MHRTSSELQYGCLAPKLHNNGLVVIPEGPKGTGSFSPRLSLLLVLGVGLPLVLLGACLLTPNIEAFQINSLEFTGRKCPPWFSAGLDFQKLKAVLCLVATASFIWTLCVFTPLHTTSLPNTPLITQSSFLPS